MGYNPHRMLENYIISPTNQFQNRVSPHTVKLTRYSLAFLSIISVILGSVITLNVILNSPVELIMLLAGAQIAFRQGQILTGISTSSVEERSNSVAHIVGEGETLWSIAYDYLGSGYSWEHIDNPKGGKNVQPGDIVYLPSALIINR